MEKDFARVSISDVTVGGQCPDYTSAPLCMMATSTGTRDKKSISYIANTTAMNYDAPDGQSTT